MFSNGVRLNLMRVAVPSVAVSAPMSREAFLNSIIGELADYWLGLRCGRCTKSTYAPLRLLATKHGRRHRLHNILKRLKCEQCKLPATIAWIVDYPIEDIQHGGRIATWHVELVP
jgi:hypothetical protein